MLKKKTKEIILCVITLIVLALVTTNVFASDINALLNDMNNTANEIPKINSTTNNTVNNTNQNNTAVNNTSNRNRNTKNNSTMPETGIDYSIVFIIAVCGVSTIYAYKKIRDYKNI